MASSLLAVMDRLDITCRGDVINDFILEGDVILDNCGVILVTILCGCHF